MTKPGEGEGKFPLNLMGAVMNDKMIGDCLTINLVNRK